MCLLCQNQHEATLHPKSFLFTFPAKLIRYRPCVLCAAIHRHRVTNRRIMAAKTRPSGGADSLRVQVCQLAVSHDEDDYDDYDVNDEQTTANTSGPLLLLVGDLAAAQ